MAKSATVNTHEAKTNLSKLLARVEAGEEVIIARNGEPVAKLVPIKKRSIPRPNTYKGQIWMSDDFDEMSEEELRLWGMLP
jgi:prevent-host-death family protein